MQGEHSECIWPQRCPDVTVAKPLANLGCWPALLLFEFGCLSFGVTIFEGALKDTKRTPTNLEGCPKKQDRPNFGFGVVEFASIACKLLLRCFGRGMPCECKPRLSQTARWGRICQVSEPFCGGKNGSSPMYRSSDIIAGRPSPKSNNAHITVFWT